MAPTSDGWPPASEAAPRDSVSVGMLVARFAVAGLVVAAVLAAMIALLARQAGTEQAVESARQVTWVTARGIAEPRLDDKVLAGDPAALAAFHEAMRRYVIQGSLVRVKVWSDDGRIIYSDESRLIGKQFSLDEEEREALAESDTDSEISDLTDPENEFERPFVKLLEVYAGIQSTSGRKVLFEAYFRYDAVALAGRAQWRQYAPPALGALALLQLVQIPFAWSLTRRLQAQHRGQQVLLRHAVNASGAERRRIAADLHDGVVQDLTGLTYELDAARLSATDSERDTDLIRRTATQLRRTTGDLRTLLVDIYPPDLAEVGLSAALDDLAGRLENAGMHVHLDIAEVADLPVEVAAVLFRCAQEILRNVATHSQAQSVQVSATLDAATATLSVDDDGRGFSADVLTSRTASGHVGLRSLGDLVEASGGRLRVRSAPGQGTRVDVVVPVP
jgi:two-component system NarL family sensor kinase